MIAFDTEDDSQGNLYIINFYDGKEHYTFYNEEDAIKFIYQCKHKELYAHNLEYDLNNIFKSHLHLLELYYLSGRLIRAKLKKKNIYFYDSFNLSYTSLKNIGRQISKDKLQAESFNDIEYCQRDCEIVYDYVTKIKEQFKEKGLKKTKSTLAGYSQVNFLKNYCTFEIEGINVNEELLQAYYGGRCEAFHIGTVEQPIAEIDVNSMYPFVMLEQYPVSEAYKTKEPTTNLYIAKINVVVDTNILFPVIPKRYDGKLMFCTGSFTTFATSIEIQKAIEYKQIKDIEYIDSYNFDLTDYVFKNFVTEVYALRQIAKQEKDEFLSNYYKLLLNSVYGRFAMNSDIEVIASEYDKGEFVGTYNNVINRYKMKIDSNEGKNYALPCFVTGYARVKLFEMIMKCYTNNLVPLYCDTDSIYCTYNDYMDVQDFFEYIQLLFTINNGLGNYSCNIYKCGAFFGAKKYMCLSYNDYEKIKCKGIPEAKRKEYITTGSTTIKKPVRLRTGLRSVRGYKLNEWIEQYVTTKTNYTKRKIIETTNLLNTIPITLEQ